MSDEKDQAQLQELLSKTEQLNKAFNELNQKYEDANAMVLQLKKKLVQVEYERGEYLQNVAHQLVAPLNAIKWHIENLTQGRLTVERGKKVLRSLYSQATLAVHLAKNFNLMSNLAGDHTLAALREPLEEVDLCKLLINLADDFQPLAWDKGVQISVDKTNFEGAPSVIAMRPLISQAFSNVIENAVKYSDPDTEIVITGNYDSKEDIVSSNVRNRGIPLRKEDEVTIFDRGTRTSEAKTLHPAGTGFGLYIAKRIVDLHQGTISATMVNGVIIFSVRLLVRGPEGKARVRESKNSTTGR